MGIAGITALLLFVWLKQCVAGISSWFALQQAVIPATTDLYEMSSRVSVAVVLVGLMGPIIHGQDERGGVYRQTERQCVNRDNFSDASDYVEETMLPDKLRSWRR